MQLAFKGLLPLPKLLISCPGSSIPLPNTYPCWWVGGGASLGFKRTEHHPDYPDHPKGSHPLPKSMIFYTLCKRPLTPPPSFLHDHVVDFLT